MGLKADTPEVVQEQKTAEHFEIVKFNMNKRPRGQVLELGWKAYNIVDGKEIIINQDEIRLEGKELLDYITANQALYDGCKNLGYTILQSKEKIPTGVIS